VNDSKSENGKSKSGRILAALALTLLALALALALPNRAGAQQASGNSGGAQPAAKSEPKPATSFSSVAPAPKKPRPLDPADVAILTGKAANSDSGFRSGANAYGYYSYPVDVNAPLFGGNTFTPVSTRVSPLPFSFGFARRGGRTSVFFSTGNLPRGVFVGRARGRRAGFFSPGFVFLGR
jgi:hypothetical protein